jgi:hypothetical protein
MIWRPLYRARARFFHLRDWVLGCTMEQQVERQRKHLESLKNPRDGANRPGA